jgi:hypothetical protein
MIVDVVLTAGSDRRRRGFADSGFSNQAVLRRLFLHARQFLQQRMGARR